MHISVSIAIFHLLINIASSTKWPVPTPYGGRQGVHGWLILPWDQPYPKDPSTPINAWFSHHTPEFWTDSPHDFQIIINGTLTPLPVAENQTLVIDLPYPPEAQLLHNEFTFTPPPKFSLNDLLNGYITNLLGVVYNGSFDTSYERIAMAIAIFDINELTTAVYLNDSNQIPNYPSMRYLTYPRNPVVQTSGKQNFYMAHQIHSAPDFDQIVHVEIDLDGCTSTNFESIYQPGVAWEIYNLPNEVDQRLLPTTNNMEIITLVSNPTINCKIQVLEEIHCVLGPSFFSIC